MSFVGRADRCAKRIELKKHFMLFKLNDYMFKIQGRALRARKI